jgi:hypothetical protein
MLKGVNIKLKSAQRKGRGLFYNLKDEKNNHIH